MRHMPNALARSGVQGDQLAALVAPDRQVNDADDVGARKRPFVGTPPDHTPRLLVEGAHLGRQQRLGSRNHEAVDQEGIAVESRQAHIIF